MTSAQLFRLSGLGLLAGAITFAAHVVLRSLITAGTDPAAVALDGSWAPVSMLGVAGAVLVLLGLPAVGARLAPTAGLPAIVGTTLLAMAWMFFGLFLSLYGLLVLPWLARKAPSLVAPSAPLPPALIAAFVAGMLTWLVGAMLLAIPFIRGRVRPSWPGYVLPASAVWLIVGNLILAPSGPASNLAVNLLSNMGPVILLAGLGSLGYRLWSGQAVGPRLGD